MLNELKDKKHLVIGVGEIGSAIFALLRETYSIVDYKDKSLSQINHPDYDVVHICFPYSEDFNKYALEYREQFMVKNEGIMIIHSTVKIGTNRILESVSSPVRGTHPNIIDGLKTFTKYFAAVDISKASLAAEYFKCMNVKSIYHSNPDETEAAKLFDTTQYGFMIVLNKWMRHWCDRYSMDFNYIYSEWNRTYNEGYAALNMSNVMRPILRYMDGQIGGHCVIPNCHLLEADIAKFILMFDEELSKGDASTIENPEKETAQ